MICDDVSLHLIDATSQCGNLVRNSFHTMHERYAWSLINVRVPKAPDKKKTITADSFWTDVLLAC